MTDVSTDSAKDVTKCKTDNDCYSVPGWPTATEKTKTCCYKSEVMKYDTKATDFATNIKAIRDAKTEYAKYAYPATGWVSRGCTSDYSVTLGSSKFDTKTLLTTDTEFKKTGIQYKSYCDSAASLALGTMAAAATVYQFV